MPMGHRILIMPDQNTSNTRYLKGRKMSFSVNHNLAHNCFVLKKAIHCRGLKTHTVAESFVGNLIDQFYTYKHFHFYVGCRVGDSFSNYCDHHLREE